MAPSISSSCAVSRRIRAICLLSMAGHYRAILRPKKGEGIHMRYSALGDVRWHIPSSPREALHIPGRWSFGVTCLWHWSTLDAVRTTPMRSLTWLPRQRQRTTLSHPARLSLHVACAYFRICARWGHCPAALQSYWNKCHLGPDLATSRTAVAIQKGINNERMEKADDQLLQFDDPDDLVLFVLPSGASCPSPGRRLHRSKSECLPKHQRGPAERDTWCLHSGNGAVYRKCLPERPDRAEPGRILWADCNHQRLHFYQQLTKSVPVRAQCDQSGGRRHFDF